MILNVNFSYIVFIKPTFLEEEAYYIYLVYLVFFTLTYI